MGAVATPGNRFARMSHLIYQPFSSFFNGTVDLDLITVPTEVTEVKESLVLKSFLERILFKGKSSFTMEHERCNLAGQETYKMSLYLTGFRHWVTASYTMDPKLLFVVNEARLVHAFYERLAKFINDSKAVALTFLANEHCSNRAADYVAQLFGCILQHEQKYSKRLDEAARNEVVTAFWTKYEKKLFREIRLCFAAKSPCPIKTEVKNIGLPFVPEGSSLAAVPSTPATPVTQPTVGIVPDNSRAAKSASVVSISQGSPAAQRMVAVCSAVSVATAPLIVTFFDQQNVVWPPTEKTMKKTVLASLQTSLAFRMDEAQPLCAFLRHLSRLTESPFYVEVVKCKDASSTNEFQGERMVFSLTGHEWILTTEHPLTFTHVETVEQARENAAVLETKLMQGLMDILHERLHVMANGKHHRLGLSPSNDVIHHEVYNVKEILRNVQCYQDKRNKSKLPWEYMGYKRACGTIWTSFFSEKEKMKKRPATNERPEERAGEESQPSSDQATLAVDVVAPNPKRGKPKTSRGLLLPASSLAAGPASSDVERVNSPQAADTLSSCEHFPLMSVASSFTQKVTLDDLQPSPGSSHLTKLLIQFFTAISEHTKMKLCLEQSVKDGEPDGGVVIFWSGISKEVFHVSHDSSGASNLIDGVLYTLLGAMFNKKWIPSWVVTRVVDAKENTLRLAASVGTYLAFVREGKEVNYEHFWAIEEHKMDMP